MISEHQHCFVCREPGWLERLDVQMPGRVMAEMVFTPAQEGWQGIPHGGAAMTALLELADILWQRERGGGLPRPWRVDWRFGDSLRIGDAVELEARFGEDGNLLELAMRRRKKEKVYLRGKLRVRGEPATVDFPLPPEEQMLHPNQSHQALEIYDNCFVCGCRRQRPGLERRFFRTVSEQFDPPLVLVRFGTLRDQRRRLPECFQQYPGRIHPGVLAALLDELCGWSGVLSGDLYGFTVRFTLAVNFLPGIGDELLGISPQPPVRGRGRRKFYFSRGVLLRRSEKGFSEIVAVARGQWLARPELARQFRETHIREELSGISFV